MITYSDIQKFYRIEKNSTSLQDIGSNFYSELGGMLEKINEKHRQSLVWFASEIYNRREQKILNRAIGSSQLGNLKENLPENLTPEEGEMYSEIASVLLKYRKSMLNFEKLNASKKTERESTGEESPDSSAGNLNLNLIDVEILKPMPSFIGSNLVHYGPFSDGDVISIPRDNAKILIKNEFARGIKPGE